MENRIERGVHTGKGLLLAAITFISLAAATPSPAGATDLTAAEQCDRQAGSEFDLERNRSFPAVATEDIRIGVALSACREAYNQDGGARTQFQLARVLDRAGQKIPSWRILGEAARNGHALAMVNYGALLAADGEGETAFGLYQRAAAMGNILAAYNLGVAYRDGVGTAVDGALAIRWFERATLAGDDVAAFNLAVMLDEGRLVAEDNARAAKFYRLAAERGNVDAMVNLGLMLESGEGVSRNPAAAQDLFGQAADRNDPLGRQKLDPIITGSVSDAVLSKTDRLQ